MTREVHAVHPEAPMKHAASVLGEHRIRHLVVCDNFRRPVGVFSQRDLLRHIAQCTARGQIVPGRISVGEVMVSTPQTVGSCMPLAEAAGLMVSKSIGCLPVVDAQGRLLGLVTTTDILEFVAAHGSNGNEPAASITHETAHERPADVPVAPSLEA